MGYIVSMFNKDRRYPFRRMEIVMPTPLEHSNPFGVRSAMFAAGQEVVGESHFELVTSFFDLFDFIIGQSDLQRSNILLEMLDFSPSNDGMNIGSLMHNVRQGDPGDTNSRAL